MKEKHMAYHSKAFGKIPQTCSIFEKGFLPLLPQSRASSSYDCSNFIFKSLSHLQRPAFQIITDFHLGKHNLRQRLVKLFNLLLSLYVNIELSLFNLPTLAYRSYISSAPSIHTSFPRKTSLGPNKSLKDPLIIAPSGHFSSGTGFQLSCTPSSPRPERAQRCPTRVRHMKSSA